MTRWNEKKKEKKKKISSFRCASRKNWRRWEIQRPRRRAEGEKKWKMVVRSVIDNSHEDTICLFFSSNRRQRRDIVLGEEDSRAASAVLQGERHKREREETPPADCQTLRIKGSSRWLPLSLFLSACLDDEMPETDSARELWLAKENWLEPRPG